ncbi:putative multidrug resistance ABC transporter ATP-binding/permease protein YheI [Luteitalea pratensis]|uniref:Putative multidrug resistance ABC transporter ATP-binding/permease protein YheI n=2 Tax=Luteitalea pratensis TaxID=1855912 RepID=A0A143PN96_LUTPR|nr:putative multidrug resistance ABC transporter ATP-binding/permease protein YheI [Luteitalea pratensis]
MLLGLCCAIVANLFALLTPWVLKYAVDDLTAAVTRAKLGRYALALLAISAGGGIFRYFMRRLIIGVSRRVEYDLRSDFFSQLQRFPREYFDKARTGDLMSRASADLGAVRMMAGPAAMYAVSTGVLAIAAVGMMLWIDTRLTLLIVTFTPLVSLMVKYFGQAIHTRFERIQAQLAEISAITQEALAGVRVVRAYGQEAAERAKFLAASDEYVARNRKLILLQASFFPSMTFGFGLAIVAFLYLGGREVIRGSLTLGEFVAFNGYLGQLAWPLIAFGWVTNMFQRGLASWQRMLEVFDTAPSIVDGPTAQRLPEPVRGRLRVRHLTFAYGTGPVVLHDIDLHVPAGSTLAIVGATGSGKSSLVHLLVRMYDPPPGTVFIDGHDVRDVRLEDLRRAIAFVPQETFLFSTTLEDNIAFGAHAMPDAQRRERVEEAAAIARLDKDVVQFAEGYQTRVGERGLTLSGGQKQRTAIARALMTAAPVLVFDDALSAVDTYTEEEILSRLRTVTADRTTIIVAHRISAVRHADQIIVLDEGRIIERGTHDSLAFAGGPYSELVRQQQLEAELAVS